MNDLTQYAPLLIIAVVIIAIVATKKRKANFESADPQWPSDKHKPTPLEQELISRVWMTLGVDNYPVWITREIDDYWKKVGDQSNAPDSSKYGAYLKLWARTGQGRIDILHLNQQAVAAFNRDYKPSVELNIKFTLSRLANLLIYERMHLMGYSYYGTSEVEDKRRKVAEQDYEMQFWREHGDWLRANDAEHNG